MDRATQGTARLRTDDIAGQRGARFLGSLSRPVWDELLGIGTPRKYSPGEKILVEGASDDYLVLLKTGVVKVTGRLGNGREALIAIRVGGDVVGEMSVFDGVPRSATVTACEDVDAQVVEGPALRSFLDKCPEAAIQIMRLGYSRLRTTNSWRIAFGAFPVRVRLARVLAELAENHGRPVRRYGRLVQSYLLIRVNLTHTELAELIGAKSETVQKMLAAFRAEGIVTTGSRRMEVIKLDRLRAIGLLSTTGS
jgi:CRP-like cAMP-binding protein